MPGTRTPIDRPRELRLRGVVTGRVSRAPCRKRRGNGIGSCGVVGAGWALVEASAVVKSLLMYWAIGRRVTRPRNCRGRHTSDPGRASRRSVAFPSAGSRIRQRDLELSAVGVPGPVHVIPDFVAGQALATLCRSAIIEMTPYTRLRPQLQPDVLPQPSHT